MTRIKLILVILLKIPDELDGMFCCSNGISTAFQSFAGADNIIMNMHMS